MVCSAMNTTATPAEFGSSTPTFSLLWCLLQLAAQHLAPQRSIGESVTKPTVSK